MYLNFIFIEFDIYINYDDIFAIKICFFSFVYIDYYNIKFPKAKNKMKNYRKIG